VSALERSLDAAYDREKALAERLRRVEENVAIVQARVADTGERIDSLGRPPTSGTVAAAAAGFDATSAYAAAYAQHQNQDYDAALAAFTKILENAPTHTLADNAQYWIGESHYALGRFRQALDAFSAVLSFETTEKNDDAQLMIARSYLALGEKNQAVSAFRRLLSAYADSEYGEAARKELRYLEGP
jgi:TolA-binding protein